MNCAALESLISGDPAVRRELGRFVRMRIYITDDKIGALADEQMRRMKKTFGTSAIPLHVILDGDGKEIARLTYDPLLTAADYLAFLKKAK